MCDVYIKRMALIMILHKKISENLNCFAAKRRTEIRLIFRFFSGKFPQKASFRHFFGVVNKNSKRRARCFEKRTIVARLLEH